MAKDSNYGDHLLLVKPEDRDVVELMLRSHPIVDERSWIMFFNEIMVQVATGKIPPEAAAELREIGSCIYQALTQAATMEVVRSQQRDPKALPEPSQARVIETDFTAAYEITDAVFVERKLK